jgi:hypothetical protein
MFGIGRPTYTYIDAARSYVERSWPELAAEPPWDDPAGILRLYKTRELPPLTPHYRLTAAGVRRVVELGRDPARSRIATTARAMLVAMWLHGCMTKSEGSYVTREARLAVFPEELQPYLARHVQWINDRGCTIVALEGWVQSLLGAAGDPARRDGPLARLLYGGRASSQISSVTVSLGHSIQLGFAREARLLPAMPESCLELVRTRRRKIFELEREVAMTPLGRALLRRGNPTPLAPQTREGHRWSYFLEQHIATAILSSVAPREVTAIAQEWPISLSPGLLVGGFQPAPPSTNPRSTTRPDLAIWLVSSPPLFPTRWVEIQSGATAGSLSYAQTHARYAIFLSQRENAGIEVSFVFKTRGTAFGRAIGEIARPPSWRGGEVDFGIARLKESVDVAPWLAPGYRVLHLRRYFGS